LRSIIDFFISSILLYCVLAHFPNNSSVLIDFLSLEGGGISVYFLFLGAANLFKNSLL